MEKDKRPVKLLKRPEMEDEQEPEIFLCKIDRSKVDFAGHDLLSTPT